MRRTMVGVGAAILMALGLGLAAGSPAAAQTPEVVVVKVGKTVTFPLPRRPQTLSSEDSSVASLEVLPSGQARVTGHKPGSTRLVGRDDAQRPIIIQVRVEN